MIADRKDVAVAARLGDFDRARSTRSAGLTCELDGQVLRHRDVSGLDPDLVDPGDAVPVDGGYLVVTDANVADVRDALTQLALTYQQERLAFYRAVCDASTVVAVRATPLPAGYGG